MAFQGFGKNSGPSGPPLAQTPFGNFSRPPSPNPSPSHSDLHFHGRGPSVPQGTRSPPVVFQNNHYADGLAPSFADAQAAQRSSLSPSVSSNQPTLSNNFTNSLTERSPYSAPPYIDAYASGRTFSAKNANVQAPKRTRSPPLQYTGEASQENSLFPRNLSERSSLSPSVWSNEQKFSNNFTNSLSERNPYLAPPYIDAYDSGRNFSTKHANVQVPKRTRSPPLPSTGKASQENSPFSQNLSERPSISPPRLSSRSNGILNGCDPQSHQRSPPSAHTTIEEPASSKPSNSQVQKKIKLPSLPSSDRIVQENSYSEQDAIEQELQAKAKRLVRFKNELNQAVQSSSNMENQNFPAKRRDQSMMEGQKVTGEPSADVAGDISSNNLSSDHEALESSSIILGLCPDMCPESERGERERKGDLDQYERFDGDRNQTSKFLAVKKYTRTAEREAELIRPMLILQKTIDYLLNLLDQPYDDRFLGLYNFLWDRMRAIRMDLRMQHLFNLGAITMLEQMIRLHIIAMHELCEYTKGEGFSEGFDAHLNIEQMNKTSVELFQLYDDHRKKGIDVPTEKEFRGYYALLKLDKHPGYKVEPAELSLELAKMAPAIRQTPEVLFARDVARACRTGNFISFFRLARKASYLQACLMHAHFAKLRTQALASLHSGLQNNQGIPVALVSKWLGMEEEGIENLLEYHGFVIKEFEEPYMVKEGLFLNVDNDHPVKCSKLVHLKKSKNIIVDVSSPSLAKSSSYDEVKKKQLYKVHEYKPVPFVETQLSVQAVDEEMLEHKAVSSPKDDFQVKPTVKTLLPNQWNGDNNQVPVASPLPWGVSIIHNSPESQEAIVRSAARPNYDSIFRYSFERNVPSEIKAKPMQIMPRNLDQERFPVSQFDSAVENSVPQLVSGEEDLEDEEHKDIHQELETDELSTSYYDEEVAEAKLKLILRIWRRRSSKKRELREQRQLAASAALSSLSLGPPLCHSKDQTSNFGELNIDHVLRNRYEKHEKSWSRMNVSDVIASKLGERNPDVKCLCWKLILCSQGSPNGDERGNQVSHLNAAPWLLSKLMPSGRDDGNDELAISSPGLSIWKKWIPRQSGGDEICCFSVIKDSEFGNLNETVTGASAVLFLVSEFIPWETQKIRLHNLLMSLPSNSHLPLLVLSVLYNDNLHGSTIVKELGLHDIDKSRMNTFLVASLVQNQQTEHLNGFFSDEQLKEGLQWLANESPSQPALCYVKTRELVLSHLNSSLDALDEMNVYGVRPEHCISAFNDALDQSMREISDAASANPCCWPCPEISLLDSSSDEHRAVVWYLPSVGWSSAARIEVLLCALKDFKLSTFPDDVSWLYRGSDMSDHIENQQRQLENCLIRYLTQSNQLMGSSLATKEASIMLQKCARLELHNSTYYIIPNWIMIFRRIFNWRLTSLSNVEFSSANILEKHNAAVSASDAQLKNSISLSPYYLVQPSLNEMVEVGSSSIVAQRQHSEDEAFQPVSAITWNESRIQELVEERNFVQDDKMSEENDGFITNGLKNTNSGLVVASNSTKEAERLSQLLEQCNMVQNMIEKKLSIYF